MMRKSKRLLLVLIILSVAVLSFAGCVQQEPSQTTRPSSPSGTQPPGTEKPTTAPIPEDPTEIDFFIYDLRGFGANAGPIEALVNELTKESVNVTAKFTWLGAADYVTQLGLAIGGNEPYDLCTIMPRPGANFTTLSSNGQLTDITDLLPEYGAEMLDLTADYIGAYKIEGRTYGVPTLRNYASSVYIVMRKDILDQIGMTEKARNMKTFTEFTEILKAVDEKTDVPPIAGNKNISYQTGMISGEDSFDQTILFDNMSDLINVVFTDGDGKISLLPENELFKKQMLRVKGWYDAGLVYKDSMITEEHVDTLMKGGVTFSSIQTSEIGVENAKREATGYELVVVEIATNVLSSNFINKFGTGVPITADEPEAAVAWLNELYTDPRVENLLVWGEEGVDYVVNNGEADYPPNIDAKSVRFHQADFVYGNFFNAHPWKGNGADFRQRAMDALKAAPVSPYLGFTPDMAELANQIAAITAVNDTYTPRIYTGAFSETDYTEYIAALKTAGVEEYLAEIQEQLDAWIAANK